MNATHYVIAPDNSMSQSRIRKGDRIMLDTGAEIKDGDLVLAVFTDGWKICRAHFAGDKSKPRYCIKVVGVEMKMEETQ